MSTTEKIDLFLDLDGTLMWSAMLQLEQVKHIMQRHNVCLLTEPAIVVGEFLCLAVRPNALNFLQRIQERYTVHLLTANYKTYAEHVLELTHLRHFFTTVHGLEDLQSQHQCKGQYNKAVFVDDLPKNSTWSQIKIRFINPRFMSYIQAPVFGLVPPIIGKPSTKSVFHKGDTFFEVLTLKLVQQDLVFAPPKILKRHRRFAYETI